MLRHLSAAVCLCFLSASPATAQDGGPEERARALFDEGARYHGAGRFDLAAEAFERAYEIYREVEPGRAALILYNLGASLDELPGREREARDAYQGFLDHSVDGEPEHLQRARARIVLLDARIERVEREARAGGDATGSTPVVEVTPSVEGGGISPIGPVLLALGGASIIAGAILGGLALVQDGDLAAACGGDVCSDTPTHRAMFEEMTLVAGLADGFLIGGAVVAALGVVLTLVLTDEPTEEVAVATACGPDGCEVVLRGSF